MIEGPGLRGWFPSEGYVDGKWTNSGTNDCLVLEEDESLKVFASRDLTYYREGIPLDGVIRDIVFTNKDSNTTINTYCSASKPTTKPTAEPTVSSTMFSPQTVPEEPVCGCYAKDEEIKIQNNQCVLYLGSFPDVAGSWSFTFDMKFNSLPTEPTDPRWFLYIISGFGYILSYI